MADWLGTCGLFGILSHCLHFRFVFGASRTYLSPSSDRYLLEIGCNYTGIACQATGGKVFVGRYSPVCPGGDRNFYSCFMFCAAWIKTPVLMFLSAVLFSVCLIKWRLHFFFTKAAAAVMTNS